MTPQINPLPRHFKRRYERAGLAHKLEHPTPESTCTQVSPLRRRRDEQWPQIPDPDPPPSRHRIHGSDVTQINITVTINIEHLTPSIPIAIV